MRYNPHRPEDILECPTCGSKWFEEAKCVQYISNTSIQAGMAPKQAKHGVHFFMMRCLVCNHITEPYTRLPLQGRQRDLYGNLIETLGKEWPKIISDEKGKDGK